MSIPALKRLLKVRSADSITLVVRNPMIAELLKEYLSSEIPVLARHGVPLSQVRMWISLLKLGSAKICAPMLSGKLLHKLFFSLMLATTYVPATFSRNSWWNFRRVPFSLENFPGHQVDYFVQFTKEAVPDLDGSNVDFSEFRLVERTPNPINVGQLVIAVGLSCSANERHKIPSVAWFVKFLVRLAQLVRVKYLLIGDHNDLEVLNGVKEALGCHVACEVVIDKPVTELISRLATCALGVSGTTGQGHMMAAAGLPILVFAGVTCPEESGPFAQRVAVLRHKFSCGPCYQEAYRQGCGEIECMDSLDHEEAVNLAQRLVVDAEFGRTWLSYPKENPIPPDKIARIHSDISGPNRDVTSCDLS